MNATKHLDTEATATRYVKAVKARVVHLGRSQRAEILEDLQEHLAELMAESSTQLDDPDTFADEYLASAGIDVPDDHQLRRRRRRTLRWSLRFVVLLIALALLASAAAAAFYWGLVYGGSATGSLDESGPYGQPYTDLNAMPVEVVSIADGTVTNLFVYDAQGDPLKNVFIYDQQGRPVSTPVLNDPGLQTGVPTGPDGRVVPNLYPQTELRGNVPVEPPIVQPPQMPDPPEASPTTIIDDAR